MMMMMMMMMMMVMMMSTDVCDGEGTVKWQHKYATKMSLDPPCM
jgi:hypothetical protein